MDSQRFLPSRSQHGFSLPELMIAVTIGLLILAGMATLFVNNSRAQAEVDKANRQIENGRFGIQMLAGDLHNAGFYGEFNPTALDSPLAPPDPCAVTLAALAGALALPVQGLDKPAPDALACLEDLKEGTDVLVVRRTATCITDAANCEPASAGGPFFQASSCNNDTQLNSADPADFYRMSLTTAGLDRRQRNCTSVANSGNLALVRRYLTHIYYVASNDKDGDDIPTLKRAELGVVDGALAFTIVPLVNGVQDLQFEYGIDNSNPALPGVAGATDGVADLFSADPGTAVGCTADECAVANWRNVVSVKLNLLARNIDRTTGHVDEKTYELGRLANGDPNRAGSFNDAYKRHVFQSLVGLPNPAGRKIP